VTQRWFPDTMPRPVVNDLTRIFFEAAREHRLVMQRCLSCGLFRHPPRPICPHCRSLEASWEELDGRGELFTWSVVHQQSHPATASIVPYVVAVVELQGALGTRFTSNLVDASEGDLRPGREVELVWEDMDEYLSLPRFRPSR
jgi:uncharacterized protein